MKKLRYLIPFLLAAVLISCEREIEIDLPNDEDLVVVEGRIRPGESPVILLTRNRGFFDAVPTDLEEFVNEFVIQDAQVIVSDGTQSEELQLTFDILHYPYIYYTGTVVKGEIGKTYSLSINYNNKVLTAETTIPNNVAIDTSWFGLNPFDINEDSLGVSYLQIIDPDTFGNAYRLYAKKNSELQFFAVSGSEFNDDFINGNNVPFFAGSSDTPLAAQDSFIPQEYFYSLGDTIYLELANIGRKEYNFYATLGAALNSNGNPFASPTLVQSNIDGGLGVWVGMSVSYDTVYATN
ncbi:MAG: DUF4249 domain-containing protein [Bacteroidia bacterium]